MTGKGKRSATIFLFKPRKSTQSLRLPSFLGTTTMGELYGDLLGEITPSARFALLLYLMLLDAHAGSYTGVDTRGFHLPI